MKPLSPLLYSRRNKKKIFVSINAVMLAVSFLCILYSFMQSVMAMEERNYMLMYNNSAIVASSEGKAIDESIINNIKNNGNVDRIVKTSFDYGIKFEIPGASDRSSAYPIRETDMDYFMNKYGVKLVEGSLPKDDSYEIVINKDIAKNRGLKVGDKVGDSINKFDSIPGEYTVVGIVNSNALISILSANEKIMPNYKNEEQSLSSGFLVFAKADKKTAMDKYLESISKDKADVTTKSIALKHWERSAGVTKVMDILAILSIIVMVITVGSSKYVQYINRKEELGLLNAVGYNKRNILKRIFKEVCVSNALGYALGLALSFAGSLFLTKGLWEPKGAEGFLYTPKGLIVSLFVPLFTILFSVIPINNLINKLDPIKMIEKN